MSQSEKVRRWQVTFLTGFFATAAGLCYFWAYFCLASNPALVLLGLASLSLGIGHLVKAGWLFFKASSR